MFELSTPSAAPFVWQVGALCRAVAGSLDARFNPVALSGEVSGFSRAASGHCYFSLKDDEAQLRCAMFRRAASLLDFVPQGGEQVEVRGRLSVYEARGELQLVVESLRRAGAGTLFEQFLRLKRRLEAQGLFDAARKRGLPPFPRAIGVVTSLQAAALHDVLSVLRRRAPQVRVIVSPARVQGAGASAELCAALARLMQARESRVAQQAVGSADATQLPIDLVLLVRGGGSIEDLMAFNDEQLAHAIVSSPVPVVVGVGHETDFTIADFCADLRAATPTAAAELAIQPRAAWLEALERREHRLRAALTRRVDSMGQRLDRAALRLARPQALAHRQRWLLGRQQQRMAQALTGRAQHERRRLDALQGRAQAALHQALGRAHERTARAELGLSLLNPALVLRRGYAWLADADQGHAITSTVGVQAGQRLRATLVDGTLELQVSAAPSDN